MPLRCDTASDRANGISAHRLRYANAVLSSADAGRACRAPRLHGLGSVEVAGCRRLVGASRTPYFLTQIGRRWLYRHRELKNGALRLIRLGPQSSPVIFDDRSFPSGLAPVGFWRVTTAAGSVAIAA